MSIIEIAPQKEKTYDNRKQDHGDAASRRGHYKDLYEESFDQRGRKKRDAESLKAAFQDDMSEIDDFYQPTTPAQLEAEADKILANKPEETATEIVVDYEEDDEPVEVHHYEHPTVENFDLPSRHEIRKRMAQRATLDPEFDSEGDDGDSDYASPIRIRTRL